MIVELILVGGAAAVILLRPWRWAWLRRALKALAHPFITPPPEPKPDPFDALRVQLRLQALACEINQLHDDTTIYARAARLESCATAYDALLGNACRMAGVNEMIETIPAPRYATRIPERLAGRDLRAKRELLLAERGWSW